MPPRNQKTTPKDTQNDTQENSRYEFRRHRTTVAGTKRGHESETHSNDEEAEAKPRRKKTPAADHNKRQRATKRGYESTPTGMEESETHSNDEEAKAKPRRKKTPAADHNKRQRSSTKKSKLTPIQRESSEETEIDTAPFELLDIEDSTKLTSEHINRIFLLDRSRVPEGGPSGLGDDTLTVWNYPNVEPSQLRNDYLPFLNRKCFSYFQNLFIDTKETFIKKNIFFGGGRYLAGPGGYGKSYILYHIVQFCRASGWLVLYIPHAGEITQKSDEDGAKDILKKLLEAELTKLISIKYDGVPLADVIKAGIEKKKYFETFDLVICILRDDYLPFPVLFAVDEWNSKFSYPSCKVLKYFIAKMTLATGFWIYAISSSFDAITYGEFQHDDENQLRKDIPAYNIAEFESILKCQKHYKRLPKEISHNQIRNMQENSGLIPQMVFNWCKVWHKNLTASFEYIRDGKNGYFDLATSYYMGRIEKILARANGASFNSQEKIKIYKSAVLIILNQKLGVYNLAKLWKISGLFDKKNLAIDGGELVWVGVCPPVYKAFMDYFNKNVQQILEPILADQTIRWRVLEILFVLHFHQSGSIKSTIKLLNRDLRGESRKNGLQLDVARVIDETGPIKSLKPGDFLVLRNRHLVVDFVAYTDENCELFFIQISMTAYANHTANVTHLTDNYPGEQKSILSHYMELCRNRDDMERFKPLRSAKNLNFNNNKLPSGVYFLYVTTSKTVVTSASSCCNHPVVLLNYDELVSALGKEWRDYRECLTDKKE